MASVSPAVKSTSPVTVMVATAPTKIAPMRMTASAVPAARAVPE